jgi:hypothetical protein
MILLHGIFIDLVILFCYQLVGELSPNSSVSFCSGYTEMDGRYCLMLKNTYKKGVGIVHGSSNTGR